jgi:mono/diheme cytochrome c family protein
MIKVLVAGLIGTAAGVVAMIIVIVLAGDTTSGASSVGLGPLPLSTAALSSGPVSTPTSTPPPDTGGGSTGGTTGATGNADNGKTIFTGSGTCGGCHALAAAGTTASVGPALDDLKGDAAKAGEPLDAFIKSSIVDPGAFVAAGYPDGVMPTTFGSSLSASDINDLVAFISASQK